MEQEKESGKQSWRSRLWARTGFGDKTVWDWLQLLSALAIPIVLAVAGFWFTAQQDTRQREIEKQRAESERNIEEQRAQDAAVQAYYDQMAGLLLDRGLRTSEEGDTVRLLARARTIAILRRLNSERNRDILQFLHEAQLISGTDSVVRLDRSNLSGAELSGVDLSGVDLSYARLDNADLSHAFIRNADLSNAALMNANLHYANLGKADLRNA